MTNPAPDERDLFERWTYREASRKGYSTTSIRELRQGDDYGPDASALNGQWRAWQGRAALGSAPMVTPPETATERREFGAEQWRLGYLAARAASPAALSPIVPEGWKLVPIEPTDEMVYAGASEEMSVGDPYGERRHEYREYSVGDAGARAAYAAMLAAAPSQPEPTAGGTNGCR